MSNYKLTQGKDNPKRLTQEAASILASLMKKIPNDQGGCENLEKGMASSSEIDGPKGTLKSLSTLASGVQPEKSPEMHTIDKPGTIKGRELKNLGNTVTTGGPVSTKRGSCNGFAKIFPEKLLEILEHSTPKDDGSSKDDDSGCIAWLPHGKSFIITDIVRLTLDVLPLFFSNKNSTETKAARAGADNNGRKVKAIAEQKFKSFTRKLYRWGFRQVTRGPDTGSYSHPLFKRNQRELCLQMKCHYSERELKVQRDNAFRAEERRRAANSKKEAQASQENSSSTAKAKYLKKYGKSTNTSEVENVLPCNGPIKDQNFRLGNRFYSSKDTSDYIRNRNHCEVTASGNDRSLMTKHLIDLGEKYALRSTRPYSACLEDSSAALADAVLHEKSMNEVMLAQRQIGIRKQHAVLLEQRAKNHLAAAAAAAAAASRLSAPNQYTIPHHVLNTTFTAPPSFIDTPHLGFDIEPDRQVLSLMEKQLLLSNAFKQSYNNQSPMSELLRQRLGGQNRSMQLSFEKADYLGNLPRKRPF